jgi:hypothetical protein
MILTVPGGSRLRSLNDPFVTDQPGRGEDRSPKRFAGYMTHGLGLLLMIVFCHARTRNYSFHCIKGWLIFLDVVASDAVLTSMVYLQI